MRLPSGSNYRTIHPIDGAHSSGDGCHSQRRRRWHGRRPRHTRRHPGGRPRHPRPNRRCGCDRRHHRGRRRGAVGLDRTGCVRPGRRPRLHRHSHPLRRPGLLGPRPDPVVISRGDDGCGRQLWFFASPYPIRRCRDARPHLATCRGHEFRHPHGRSSMERVRDLPGIPRRRRETGGDPQLRLLCRPYGCPPLRHGPGGLRASGHR